MSVTFFEIPLILTPGVFVENNAAKAASGSFELPNRTVVIGSMLPAAVPRTTPNILYQMTNVEAGLRFGRNSQLHKTIRGFKAKDSTTELWAIGQIDDGAGIAHEKTITISGGPSTVAGVWHFFAHGEVRVDVLIPAGTNAETAAGLINTAIGLEDELMFTSGVVLAVATITTNHASEFSSDLSFDLNFFDGQDEDAPDSLIVTIADVVAGVTNPDITTTLAAIGDEWFTRYVVCWADIPNILAVETELAERWSGTVQQDALAYYGAVGTHGDLLNFGASTDSQFTVILEGGSSPTPPWIWAAQASAASSKLTNPALPRQTEILPSCVPPPTTLRFKRDERQLLLKQGIATHRVIANRSQIERLVTTSKTDPKTGLLNSTFRSENVMLQLAAIRFSIRARISSEFPQAILVSVGTDVDPGVVAIDTNDIRGALIDEFRNMQSRGWVENIDQFIDDLIVEISDDDPNTVDAVISTDLANQFIAFRVRNDFLV